MLRRFLFFVWINPKMLHTLSAAAEDVGIVSKGGMIKDSNGKSLRPYCAQWNGAVPPLMRKQLILTTINLFIASLANAPIRCFV
jgi:hypothetical protein